MLKKPVGLKRILFVVLTMSGILVFYLLWQQSVSVPNIPSTLRSNVRKIFTSNKVPDPIWTWECKNKKCERHQKVTQAPPTSLTTCNMLCGSSQLWPQPTGPIALSSKAVTFLPSQIRLEVVREGQTRDMLQNVFNSFCTDIKHLTPKLELPQQITDVKAFLVKINIKLPDITKLRLKTDESYNITIKMDHNQIVATIHAPTYFGARHALVTLAQLVWWDEYASGGMLKIIKAASIQDKPAFAYRGILLDTARNFFSVESIKKALIGMAANKLNIFHWHLTDSQSFPFNSPRVPQLAKFGAYGLDMTYNAEDIKELVDFANTRGIRVIIEIDTPAHAGNGWTWGPLEGLGDLAVCVNEQPWSLYCGEPPCGQLNPQNPNTYDVLEKLYEDILELSGEDEIFHLGGDEVNLECWSQHLHWGTSFANYTDLHDLWGDFTLKALQRLTKANGGKLPSHVLVWSSNLSKRPYTSKYLDRKHIIVQSWGPSMWPETLDLLQEGYRVILSHVDAWYLDCGYGRWRETGEAACDPYRPWQSLYSHRPWQQYKHKKNVLGGEACLWTEQVDEDLLDTRLWPRAAAFAERMWSDPKKDPTITTIDEDVYTRLTTQRERLVRLGLSAEAMWPYYCTQNPGACL